MYSMIDTISKVTGIHEKVSLMFDRGYGKLSFMKSIAEKNFEVTTLGSRHPFLSKEEISKVKKNWERKKADTGEIEVRINLYNNWVTRDQEKLGSGIRFAVRGV